MRKLYRNLFPQNFRSIFYANRKHLSHLGKDFSANLDSRYWRRHERLSGLADLFLGKRCFIMGNGPSLNNMNLNLFKNEYVWGSNRCYLLFDRINWRPSFYVAVDKRVVPDNADEINTLVHNSHTTKFFFPTVFKYNKVIRSNRNIFWFDERPYVDQGNASANFSLDSSIWISAVRTVTISALQLAVYLGFNPIYLIGCDTSYTIPTNINFENDDNDFLISTEDNDPNHFSPDYFGTGKKWHDPHVDRMIKHYEESLSVANSINVKIYNATVGGQLEVFPRVNYLDLF